MSESQSAEVSELGSVSESESELGSVSESAESTLWATWGLGALGSASAEVPVPVT